MSALLIESIESINRLRFFLDAVVEKQTQARQITIGRDLAAELNDVLFILKQENL